MDDITTEIDISSDNDAKVQAVLLAVKGFGTMFAVIGGVVAGIAASKEFNKTIAAAVEKKLTSQ